MDSAKKMMNFVNVRFLDEEGAQIVDDLKIYNIIGSQYQVNTPCLSRYILTKYKGKLEGVITEERKEVQLIYAPLGKLIIKNALKDAHPEEIAFITTSQPDQVSTIKLPPAPAGREYYLLTEEDGIESVGEKVKDPDIFLPTDPTSDLTIVALNDADLEVLGKKPVVDDSKATTETKTEVKESTSGSVSKSESTSEAKVTSEAEEKASESQAVAPKAKESVKIEKPVETKQTEKGERTMNLDIPMVMLVDAFEQVVKAVTEEDLTKKQKDQLIAKANEFLDSIELLAK